MTWPVTQRFVFSQSTEQTVPSAKANSPLNAPVLLMVFSVGLFTDPFSCSSMVYSVRAFLGAGFFDELLRFFWGSSSDSTMSSSSSSSSDSDLRGPRPSLPETTHGNDGTPGSREDSFSNSLPSFDWPSSYCGAAARLARLGRDAMVLLACVCCVRAIARRTRSETAGQTAALLRHVRGRFAQFHGSGGRVATLEQRRRLFLGE